MARTRELQEWEKKTMDMNTAQKTFVFAGSNIMNSLGSELPVKTILLRTPFPLYLFLTSRSVTFIKIIKNKGGASSVRGHVDAANFQLAPP
uniref:Uncharacterized protein n=1 Tax=Anguilla anguilla TaxID=7936 RepID=A0A0E9RNN8_ANGAN